MKAVQVILLAIVCLVHAKAEITTLYSGEVGRDGQLRALEYIGDSSTTKTLFVDKTAALTWAEAKTYCGNTIPVGSRLASVLSTDYTYLVTKKDALGNGKIYWTSGRDQQEWDQFRWDNKVTDTEAVLAAGTLSDGNVDFYVPTIKTCLAVMVMKDGSAVRLAGLDCLAKYPVLCQLDKIAPAP